MAVMMRSMLEVADNSGARKLQMILPLGGSTGLNAGLGDVITAAVKEAAPEGQAKKGTVVKAVIVRTRKEHRRRDGTYIRFDSNAAVLINDAGEPVGTRVFGPVARELREKKFLKIRSSKTSFRAARGQPAEHALPTGSPASLINTAAFVKADVGAIAPPVFSGAHRRPPSPLCPFCLAFGAASFTQAVITSPKPAFNPWNRPAAESSAACGRRSCRRPRASIWSSQPWRNLPLSSATSCRDQLLHRRLRPHFGTLAALRTISFSFQRFSFDSGRVSSRRTTSPVWASFFSSWA